MKYLNLFLFFLVYVICMSSCEEDLIPSSTDEYINVNFSECTSATPLDDLNGGYNNVAISDIENTVSQTSICKTQERRLEFTTDATFVDITQSSNVGIGLLYDDVSVSEGLPRLLPMADDHKPTLYSSIPGVQSIKSESSSFSDLRNARNELINQISDETEFDPILEVRESSFVHSKLHARFIFESKAKTLLGSASAESFFDLSGGYSGTTFMVVRGMQTWVESADIPNPVSSMFNPNNLPSSNTCPVFLKNIVFGKLHVLIFESDSIGLDFKQRFSGSVNALLASGSSSLEAEQRAVLQSARIRSMTIGGADTYTINEALPFSGFELPEFAVQGTKWGKNNFGVPLSYNYTYLDGTPFTTSRSTEYTVVECEQASPYTNIRTCSSGSNPGSPHERAVHLTGKFQVMTGISIRERRSNITPLRLQYRDMYLNGELGVRGYEFSDEVTNPAFELIWEAPPGYVVVTFGLGIRADKVRTLKVVIARPELNEAGELRLVGHQTRIVGDDPLEEYVEAFCEGFSPHQVVRGVEVRAHDSNLTTLRLKVAVLD